MPVEKKAIKLSSAGEHLVVKDGGVELHLPGAPPQIIPIKLLLELLQENVIYGLTKDSLPDQAKWRIELGKLAIYILELKPELRSVQWISPESKDLYGPEVKYNRYRLAFPFMVLKVVFVNGRLIDCAELFYRNYSLSSLEDALYWSNLLNVSPNAHNCTAWICTQYLADEMIQIAAKKKRPLTELEQLNSFLLHIFGGGFNRSSEAHEGRSCYQKAVEEKVDCRVTAVEKWQEASEHPEFILTVPWKPAGLTVRGLIAKQLEMFGSLRDLTNVAELINLLLGKKNGDGAL